MENMKQAGLFIVGVIVFFLFTYGCYWALKTVSYTIFYEDMVRETVREMVKPEHLFKIDQ